MYKIYFDPKGSTLKVDINYLGTAIASYVYQLWETKSNAVVFRQSGNNANSQDDNYDLPTPVSSNEGRLIDILSTLRALVGEEQVQIVNIKVFQGSKKIGDISETVDTSNGATVVNQIFIQLLTQ